MLKSVCIPPIHATNRRSVRLALSLCLCALPAIPLRAMGLAQGQSSSTAKTPANRQQKSAPRTGSTRNRKPVGIDKKSFRVIVPPLAAPKVEGLYDYSSRVAAPSQVDTNLTASVESGRVPMTPEQSRAAAKQRLAEAENLRAAGTAQSLRAAMARYEDALRLSRAAGKMSESGEIASTLNQLASIADALGDRQQAINYYNQSIPLWRAATDRQSEAAALTQLGRIYNSLGDKQQAQQLFNQARLIVQTSS